MSKLNGKVALVTSATRGIGLASALKLAKEGATVYLGVRRLEATQEICDNHKDLKMIPVYFDAYKEEYCNMFEAGIVDPTKVTRSALQNAASIASMVLTTESVVADKKDPAAEAASAAAMNQMGGGMY